MAKTTENTKTSKTKVIDVTHPSGSLAPDTTARPVIVSNRPLLKDPMVTGAPELNTSMMTTQHTAKKIKPLSDSEDDDKSEHSKESDPAVAVADEVEASEVKVVSKTAAKAIEPAAPKVPKTEPKPEPKSEAEPEAEPADSKPEQASQDTDTDTKVDKRKSGDDADDKAAAEAAAAEAEAKRKANLQTLVDNKTYFLPINAVSLRRSQQVSVAGLLLIIVLSVAWLDLAADAGFIHAPLLPLTHFFH